MFASSSLSHSHSLFLSPFPTSHTSNLPLIFVLFAYLFVVVVLTCLSPEMTHPQLRHGLYFHLLFVSITFMPSTILSLLSSFFFLINMSTCLVFLDSALWSVVISLPFAQARQDRKFPLVRLLVLQPRWFLRSVSSSSFPSFFSPSFFRCGCRGTSTNIHFKRDTIPALPKRSISRIGLPNPVYHDRSGFHCLQSTKRLLAHPRYRTQRMIFFHNSRRKERSRGF